MFSFNSHSKILLAVEPVDLRKNFAGLWALAAESLGVEPRSDSVFVFTNRAHSRVKILAWDGTGVWVCAKRLEKGTFAWPRNAVVNRSHRAAAAAAAPAPANGHPEATHPHNKNNSRFVSDVNSSVKNAANESPPKSSPCSTKQCKRGEKSHCLKAAADKPPGTILTTKQNSKQSTFAATFALTTTAWKTPFAPARSVAKTTSSSAPPKPVNAPPFYTP
jgi:transposase